MQDKTAEQNAKKKTLAVVFTAGIVFMLAASWYATQNVAELCGYSPLLGFNISHIYLPWHYFIWCYTPEIAEAIPQILEGQRLPKRIPENRLRPSRSLPSGKTNMRSGGTIYRSSETKAARIKKSKKDGKSIPSVMIPPMRKWATKG